jgi:hypothetical protein
MISILHELRNSLHAVEVARAEHELLFLLRESRETIAKLLAHASGVVASEVDGVGKPADPELLSSLSGGDACERMEVSQLEAGNAEQTALTLLRIIPGFAPVTVERDCNLPLASRGFGCKIATVKIDRRGVRDEQRVPNDPRLGRRVTFGGLGTIGATSRSMDPERVAEDGRAERFVEGDPKLDPIAESIEGHFSEVDKVASSLLLVEPALVARLQGGGKVPVAVERAGQLAPKFGKLTTAHKRVTIGSMPLARSSSMKLL